MKRFDAAKANQRGAVLVVGLIFLAMLTVMGVAAYSVATQEEKMAGNARDRMRAFEAAEASLRDCESLLGSLGGLPNFDGTGGMYAAPPVTSVPVFESITWTNNSSVRVLANAMTDVAVQPRCIVEDMLVLEAKPADGAVSGPQQRTQQHVYRVSATGFGANPTTTSLVQSTYRRQ
jgi:type IV pilus assembly protein PilX